MSLKIGITGGLSSGKSTAASIFKELGACFIDADTIAHGFLEDIGVKNKVRKFFKGKDILSQKGGIDREKLGKIAFLKKENVDFLNNLIHPLVVEKIKEEFHLLEREKVVVVEVPLLYEAHLEHLFDIVIVIEVEESNQIKRSRKRNKKLTEKEVRARIRHQIPLNEKIKLADYVVNNNGSLKSTREQITKIWNLINK
jgi:dephospho-CoA kinase